MFKIFCWIYLNIVKIRWIIVFMDELIINLYLKFSGEFWGMFYVNDLFKVFYILFFIFISLFMEY